MDLVGFYKVKAVFKPLGYIHIGSTEERMYLNAREKKAYTFTIKPSRLVKVLEEGDIKDADIDLLEEFDYVGNDSGFKYVSRVPRNPKPYIPGSSIKGALMTALLFGLEDYELRAFRVNRNKKTEKLTSQILSSLGSVVDIVHNRPVPLHNTIIIRDVDIVEKLEKGTKPTKIVQVLIGGKSFVEVYNLKELEFEFYIRKEIKIGRLKISPHDYIKKGLRKLGNIIRLNVKNNEYPFALGAGSGGKSKAPLANRLGIRTRVKHKPRKSTDNRPFGIGYLKLEVIGDP